MAQAPAKRAARSAQPASASEVSRLEREIENLQNALTRQQLSIRKGYICTIYDAGDGTFIGSCPTLHAGSQGHTYDEASQELDDAVDAVFEAFEEWQ
ncbi:MAG: type II toxin-antitoxin system HicB family antitoxin, partial [Armatimonadetes bacterium]|nr:type II toxin-antitoxin system HicB family antitoxin [Armatimonadota bacterium]